MPEEQEQDQAEQAKAIALEVPYLSMRQAIEQMCAANADVPVFHAFAWRNKRPYLFITYSDDTVMEFALSPDDIVKIEAETERGFLLKQERKNP